jgi:hypothetical protein
MKKNRLLAGVVLVLLSVLTGCASFSPDVVQDVKGTPQNSVLVYGFLQNTNKVYFSQMNHELPPDFQKADTSGFYFLLKPVAPGSRYAVEYIDVSKQDYPNIYYFFDFLSLQVTILGFSVPKKTGLYYYGAVDALASLKANKKVSLAEGNTDKERKWEMRCLDKVLPAYEGTAWESTIRSRIEELENDN